VESRTCSTQPELEEAWGRRASLTSGPKRGKGVKCWVNFKNRKLGLPVIQKSSKFYWSKIKNNTNITLQQNKHSKICHKTFKEK